MYHRAQENFLLYMPFAKLTDFELEQELQSTKNYFLSLMEENNFHTVVKENKFYNEMNERDDILCKYYDTEEFTSLKLGQSQSLNIFSLNIRSLPKHAGELSCFLNSLETKFDIIVLNEIGRCDSSIIDNIFMGYTLHVDLPMDNMKGGVGIYISNRLGNVTRNTDFEFVKSCECALCEVESVFLIFNWFDIQFNILSVYRHPRGNKNHFIDDLNIAINKIKNKNITYLIGDTNIDILKFDKNNIHSEYVSTLFENGFHPLVTFPTRITSHSATLIDHMFIKTHKDNLHTTSGIIYCDISDHLACFLSTRPKVNNTTNKRPKVRLFGQKQCDKFVEQMNLYAWENLYSANNDWYHEFIQIVSKMFNSSFPMVTISRKRIKDKPWITKGLKISCKKSSKLYKASLKKPNSPAAIMYSRYNKILKSCIKKAETIYHSEIFESKETTVRQLWKHLGTLINSKGNNKHKHIEKILFNGRFHSDNRDISNAMNEHFCKVGESLQSTLPPCDSSAFKKHLPDRIMNSFVLSHVLYEDIMQEIKSLDPKKSTGHDGIGAKIIKLCPEIFATNLCKIFNKSIDNGEYPSDMKIARVIALFKKGNKNDPNNYRPISLLSCFNKIFERLICKQLLSFLEKYNILVKYQFGFRQHHSTILALTEITDHIRCLLDNGNYVLGLFVDLSKAFDTVDHKILLYKLAHYGIRGHANNFFESYLSNRKQYTYINNENSSMMEIKCGVPQGSVLGPVLFLIYINDICHAVGDESARLFADDTGIFTHGKILEPLIQNSIITYRRLFCWCLDNRLTINCSKTCFIVFRTKNKRVPNDLQHIKIDDIVIDRVNVTKYLGLYLDEYLTWDVHVTKLCKSLMRYFGIFKNLRDSITNSVARQLYHAFIYSRIDYGVQVYGSCSNKLLSKIQILSNKLLKFLLKRHPRTPTNHLYNELKILKVTDIFEVNVLAFVKKCLYGQCPTIFQNYYTYQQHNYPSREPKLYIHRHRTNLAANSLKIKGASLWNNLDTEIKGKAALKSFKRILKVHYLSKYR